MKIDPTEYNMGDVLLIRGSCLEIERALTVTEIQVRVSSTGINIYYGFEQSKWMANEDDVIRKVEVVN